MKHSNSKLVGCLIGGVVLGTFSLLSACGDDAVPAEDVADAAPAPAVKDSSVPDVQAPVDAAPPVDNDAGIKCPTNALFCDGFDQANRTNALDGWTVFDGETSDFSLSDTSFTTAPRALQVKRPVHSGVTAEKLIAVTKSTVTLHADYRIETALTSVAVIPPVLVDIFPHPAKKTTNSILVNHRGSTASVEWDDGNGTADSRPVSSSLNTWHHAKFVIVAASGGVTGTVTIDNQAPASITLPDTGMTQIAVHVGQIYAEDPPNQATVFIDNVIVTEE